MSTIRKYEPLWGEWYVDSLIGEGSYGEVYKIRREHFGQTYHSALKIISIPHNPSEINSMKLEGLDDASIHDFFHALVVDITQEISLMSAFRGTSHIVSFEDHKIIENPDAIGWDILIRMELLESLTSHAQKHPLSHSDILKLGIHMCRALEICARQHTIHRDIKPDNIFISPYGEYKLGDFGIARQIAGTMSGMSQKGSYASMAPEVFRGERYGPSIDTYSLGMVLYTFLNKNRSPFLPDSPHSILPHHRDTALRKRMGGEPIPPLNDISPELNDLVLKACAYNRQERFTGPAEMRQALESIAAAMPLPKSTGNTSVQPDTANLSGTKMPPAATAPVPSGAMPPSETRTPSGTTLELDMPSPPNAAPHSGTAALPDTPGPSDTAALASKDKTPAKDAETAPSPPGIFQKKRWLPLAMSLSAAMIFVLIAVAIILFQGSASTETGYGISVNGRTNIVLSSSEEAQAVLDDLTAYYTDLAVASAITVTSVSYEETVEVVDIHSSKIMNRTDALQALINGTPQISEHTAGEGETIQEIAQRYSLSATTILAENDSLTEDAPLTEGTLIKLVIPQPYLHVILEGTCELTEEIEFETETKKDDTVILHTTEVQQEGEKGSRTLSCAYVSRNGLFIEKEILDEVIVKEPITQIILEGTKHLAILLERRGITNEELAAMIKSGEIPHNTTALHLATNQITDLTPLKALPNLTWLSLISNKITDLSPLQSLTHLAYLDLSYNTVASVAPLRSLTKLTTLNLNINAVNSLEGLQSLTNLTELMLDHNDVSNLTPLQPLVNLTYLSLYVNNISNIDPLQSLTKLNRLELGSNSIKDVTPLQYLIQLKTLHLDGNAIDDLTPLKKLSQLEYLGIVGNPGSQAAEDLKSALPKCSVSY